MSVHIYVVRYAFLDEDEQATAHATEEEARKDFDMQKECCDDVRLEIHRFDLPVGVRVDPNVAARIWNQRSNGWNKLERFQSPAMSE